MSKSGFHPVCEIFPVMNDAQLEELAADISENGLREPIWRFDGQIIDGRNRYLACTKYGIEPTYREWTGNGNGDLTKFVVSLNLHRRHLNESQRAMIAAKFATRPHGYQPKQSENNDLSIERSLPVKEAGELVGVSGGSVARAKTVKKLAIPEIVAAVESGEMRLHEAEQISREPQEKQTEILKARREGLRREPSLKKSRVNTRALAKTDSAKAIRNALGTMIGLCTSLAQLDAKDANFTAEEAKQFDDELVQVVATIRRLRRQLTEVADQKPSGKIEWLKVDDLSRDPEINVRPIDESRAKRYAADFDIDALGIVTASRRKDGRNIILDGQHRCEALRFMGWNGEKIPVMIFDNLTREEEAERFLSLNTHIAIKAIDRFMSRVTAKEKVACAISEIVRQNGFIVDRATRDGVIVAVNSLEDVYLGKNQKIRGKNPKALHGTLHCIVESWGRTSHAVGATVIAGIGAFLLRYGDEIKLDRLIEKLKGIAGGADGLVNRGRGKRELHGGKVANGVAHYLVDEYNAGLRGASKLLPWRE